LLYKTCTRKEIHEIKGSSDIKGLQRINGIGGEENKIYLVKMEITHEDFD
jgi:hypothetical protein